ncbi:hypothetical protein TNCT_169301 [Trichonephila clavata]|uniref:Uncharacterized protein n=1 Tax=Trichonephila clavata TaxID=2740835 RepID=A0A8X6FX45_TRICU|nr:hypothetical protein TNCT_169301 [Trichonephila clavata]
MKVGQALRERDDQKTKKAKMWKRKRRKLRKSHIDIQKLGNSAPERRPCMEISVLKGEPFPCIMGPEKDGKKERRRPPLPFWTAAEEKFKSETRTQNRRSLTQRE